MLRSHASARLVTCVLAALALAGCGEFQTEVTLEFSLDYERAVRRGWIQADADQAALLARTVEIVDARLSNFGVRRFRLRSDGMERFTIELPQVSDSRMKRIVGLVTTIGRVEFRIEVLPKGLYRSAHEGSLPARLASDASLPWHGTHAEFVAFKEAEVVRWREAREADAAYVPTDERYRLVIRVDAAGDRVEDFLVLEELPQASVDFGGSILVGGDVSDDVWGRPVLVCDVREDCQDAFTEFTRRNVGLPMGIVRDGVSDWAPTIGGPLGSRIQLTLGHSSRADLQAEAETLRAAIECGVLPLQPTWESVTER